MIFIYAIQLLILSPTGMSLKAVPSFIKRLIMPYDMYEIRPFLAQKFIFNMYVKTIHLQNPYLYTKLEKRFFWYPEPDTSYNKTRLRIRIGGRLLFGKSNVLENKTFYIPWYFEAF